MEAGRSELEVKAEKENEGEMSDITLPQVEVKIYNKTLLIKVQCLKQQGILSKLFNEVEKFDLFLLDTSVLAFGPTASDITFVAEMGDECRGQVKRVLLRHFIQLFKCHKLPFYCKKDWILDP